MSKAGWITDAQEAIETHSCPLCGHDKATDKAVLAVTWPVYQQSRGQPGWDGQYPQKMRTILERTFDLDLDADETLIHCAIAAIKVGGIDD